MTVERPLVKPHISRVLALALAVMLALAPLCPGEASAPEKKVYTARDVPLARSVRREDYPDLTDAAYANFRAVTTTGMGERTLYRSSSPINPKLGRSLQADAAARAAGIRTVINLADRRSDMARYPGYDASYYSALAVIALDADTNVASENFRTALVTGLRFLIPHKGPYLIHCTEGKDRAGFACAVLECLMGGTAREIVDDYMLSYRNYYGVLPGSRQYDEIAGNNLLKDLRTAFHGADIADPAVDPAACAKAYLMEPGMTAGEIAALKDRLGAAHPLSSTEGD